MRGRGSYVICKQCIIYRQLHREEHVYYNAVVKDHQTREKTEHITNACADQPQIQSENTPPENMGGTVGHYESLHTTTAGSENVNAMSTYAELK